VLLRRVAVLDQIAKPIKVGGRDGNRNPSAHATTRTRRETGKSKTCVWRWQDRFVAEGVDGLLPDKPRARALRSSILPSPNVSSR
jgi:hypothetical protein